MAGMKRRVARAVGFVILLVALVVPAAAIARDRDHDHMRDSWEKKHHLSVHKANGRRDADGDHLSNLGEFRAQTDPQDVDTDNDCIGDDDEDADNDGVDNESEMQEHSDPGDADTDNDGVDDGDEDGDHDGVSNAQEDEQNEAGEVENENDNCQGDEDGEVENEVDDD